MRETAGDEIAYIWAREHGGIIGGHIYILLHSPAGYNWQGQRVQQWIERISGNRHKTGAIKTTRVGGTAKAHESNPELYLANLATIVGYVIKGTCPKAGAALELARIKPQGRVLDKRCGWSENTKGQRKDGLIIC